VHFQINYPQLAVTRMPRLFFVCLGAFLGLSLTAFILLQKADQRSDELLQIYGASLVELLSEDAAPSLASDDMVGLQALLQAAVAQPRIKLAEVYDIQQVLLVQAGSAEHPHHGWRSFQAHIYLHGEIIGQFSIALDTTFSGESLINLSLLAAAGLLLLLAVLFLYDSERGDWLNMSRFEFGTSKRKNLDVAVMESAAVPASTFDPGDQSEFEPERIVSVMLKIHLCNLNQFQRQLSQGLLEKRSKGFESSVGRVLDLYGGELMDSDSDEGMFTFRFVQSTGLADSQFAALCAAWMLQKLERDQKLGFRFRARLYTDEEPEEVPFGSEEGIYVKSDGLSLGLEEKIVLENDGEESRMNGVAACYAPLLNEHYIGLTR